MPPVQPALFEVSGGGATILTDTQIKTAVEQGLLIDQRGYEISCVEPSSYDLRVGFKAVFGGRSTEISLREETLDLPPGGYAGVISMECLVLPPDVCARLAPKRSLSYDGIILLTGGIVDPGYEGHLLFALYNASQKRAIIRSSKKICTVVFERLQQTPEKQAPRDTALKFGNFPEAFIERMANMEVLPWMQISERVKQIETITKDILDLKARYEDVLKPIRDLTENVGALTKDVTSLTTQTRQIGADVEKVNTLISDNGKQINQLTTNLLVLTTEVGSLKTRTVGIDQHLSDEANKLMELRSSIAWSKWLVAALWAIILLGLGSALPEIIKKFWH